MASLYNKHKILFWLTVIVLQQLFYLSCFDGTGDDGDSIAHYMHGKYAFEHPYMFVHLWAKPVLVTLSCIFAQFGMTGMKVFNSICAISAGYFAYRLAKELGIKHAELCIPVLMLMPRYLHHSLSALTEPLFSCLAVTALFLLPRNKNLLAAIIVSWLPFARPEGMFFVAAIGLYFLLKKKFWKYIPILSLGSVVMCLAGYLFFEQKLLWVFNKSPYPAFEEKYNRFGEWLHFVLGLKELYGLPIYYLFWIGFAVMSFGVLKNWRKLDTQYHKILVLGAIFVVIASHTIFHRFSIFASFGLLRTVLTVSPLSAIIAVAGLSAILTLLDQAPKMQSSIKWISMAAIVAYTYSGHLYTFKFPDDFKLQPKQLLAEEVSSYVQKNFPDTRMKCYFYPHLSITFDQDPFDWRTHHQLTPICLPEKGITPNTIIIWDEWYAVEDGRITEEMLQNYSYIEPVKSFQTKSKWGKTQRLEVYKSKKWD